MSRPWPDPRDNDPEPHSRFKEIMVYFIAAVIGAGIIANVARGLMGYGWNW